MLLTEAMKVPVGVKGWRPPHVPMRTMVSVRWSGRISRVLKSMLARASNSFMTMSILSQPIPVESTVMRLPWHVPVMLWNSRLVMSCSMESKWEATVLTRPGSPTRMTRSANWDGWR